ncbi:Eco57I restriction-modification methylase domain-containing protein [Aliarcobacter butzleri]|uniref:Eco57I restriction-modification methylase domain-containing protein n=1 Tax=Aliarcobacter butzleri TaxID=28197 RepID=UPI001EDE1296|nr:N-6 DNA methylase [Aliarcobacter butzleri]MCG3681947.1 Eco57I restriction-modification methylase domain-containing protein [Aliarcobacter butzleri]
MSIEELVNKYTENISTYKSSAYNETQLRTDFLDKFFTLLGWDINNNANLPTNQREVLVEESLRSDDSLSKRPDYTFRLFSERKFFVEAKKPSVRIEVNDSSAKQTRRYGFSARLKISVLTNFEYLAIYECSEQVNPNDTYDRFRVKIYHYLEYVDYFEEIKGLLGKESVYNGSFDTNWEHIEDKIRQFGVDKVFLNQINEWKLSLGRQIYSFNNNIDEVSLNDIVQKYINSIVFLRVCEDRNLEIYETLFRLATEESIENLKQLFINADRKYNSGLFSYDYTNNIIDNTGSVFWSIIKQLYYPESTYSFSVFSSDILGNIYELFLTKKLFIENGIVNLRDKIEYRDRSIVTTPVNIIHDLLKETVQKYCENKNDIEILNSKFADIACGSGAFLLEAFQLLNDTLIDYYLSNDITKLECISSNTYKLPFLIKKKLLINCIFGVDKDLNAVEACKFGLLLKLLEYENNNSIITPSALPDLTSNIEWGNSLIDFNSEGLRNQDISSINPYTFRHTFDVIIGNPPYMKIEDITNLLRIEKSLYKLNYQTAFQQYDKYFLFVERAFALLSENGYLGYIVPSKFYKVAAGKQLREVLIENKCVKKIVSFGWHQMFSEKTTYTCLLILQKTTFNSLNFLEVDNINKWKTNAYIDEDFTLIDFDNIDSDNWILVSKKYRELYNKLLDNTDILSNLLGSKENIFNGIQTSRNKIYVHKYVREDLNFYYINYENREWKIEKELTRPYYETVRGNGLEEKFFTYRLLKPNAIVIYPYFKNSLDEIELVDIVTLRTSFPEAYSFLEYYKNELENRKMDNVSAPENKWYRFARNQNLDKWEVDEKIIVGVNSQANKYVIDKSRTLVTSGGTAGYCMLTLPIDSNYSIYYIQAILNSKYLEWIVSLHGEVFRGGFIARGTKVLQNLPIKNINFENLDQKTKHDNIEILQRELISLQSEIDNNRGNIRNLTTLKRQFHYKQLELNSKIKELYELSDYEDNLVPIIGELYESN